MAEINNVVRLIGLPAKLPVYFKQFLNILYGFLTNVLLFKNILKAGSPKPVQMCITIIFRHRL